MAFYDDVHFVVSHIRNSYVTSDDTGTCELVIVDGPLPTGIDYNKKILHNGGSTAKTPTSDSCHEDDGGQQQQQLQRRWRRPSVNQLNVVAVATSQSPDIVSDMDLHVANAHRRRSNTAQRLDRLKKERQIQALIQRVQWRERPMARITTGGTHEVESDSSTLFPKKDPQDLTTKDTHSSLLAELLDKQPAMPTNPFTEFAGFGGNLYAGGMGVKRISIFLTMLPPARRAYPMPISVVASAKIQELIGFICWKYTHERREPKLRNSVENYSLHIAEDDGEVDLDFPCLDPREVVSKFGFSVLALVEKGSGSQSGGGGGGDTAQHGNDIYVTVHVPGEGPSTFSVESSSLTLADVLEKFVKHKMLHDRRERYGDWRLAKRREPHLQLDMRSTLATMDTLDFSLVFFDAGTSRKEERKASPFGNDMAIMEAPLYESYDVAILNKVFSKTPIHLGVSGEKIEIVPLQQHHQKNAKVMWSRFNKPVSYDTETVVNCNIFRVKSSGKTMFRLTCAVHDRAYKNHEFEAESKTANEIVQKINHIMQLRLSQARRDYLALKELEASPRQKGSLSIFPSSH